MELIQASVSVEPYLPQVWDMAAKAMAAGLSIGCYPADFPISRFMRSPDLKKHSTTRFTGRYNWRDLAAGEKKDKQIIITVLSRKKRKMIYT